MADFYPASAVMEWYQRCCCFVILLTTVPLYLSRVRTDQLYSDEVITNAVAFVCTVLDLPLGCAKLVYFLMPDGSLER